MKLNEANVLTLNDLYDIIGADPSQSPVYSQNGFWTWFQRSWQEFMILLRQIYAAVAGGVGSSGSSDSADVDNPSDDDNDDEDTDFSSLLDIIKTVFNGIAKIIVNVVSTLFNGLAGLAEGVGNLGSWFGNFDPNSASGVYYYPITTPEPTP